MKVKGKTLTQVSRKLQKDSAWVAKLAKNAGKKLARVEKVGAVLPPVSLKHQNEPKLVLIVSDLEANLPKINKALEATFTDNKAQVQFGRICSGRRILSRSVESRQKNDGLGRSAANRCAAK